jgi:SAM-dependent methyltransferase
MSFEVAAERYDRFMGRYSRLLSAPMADFAGVAHGARALDVGCGPGALTTELVARLGAEAVVAVDPSSPFVEAARARHPGVQVLEASAEALPFEDGTFDVALAQLVVHFMADPVAGIGEMRRVTRRGGVVSACVWDYGGGISPLGAFWQAARELQPDLEDDESRRAGARAGHLTELFEAAGLRFVEETALPVRLEHPTFEGWWEPFEGGVAPAGAFVQSLDGERREVLRNRCRELLGPAPFTVRAQAWAARGAA